MKDFFDLYTLCNQLEFEGGVVQRAIYATFERRKTAIPSALPLALTSEFTADSQKASQWIAFLRKGNLASGNLSLADVADRLEEFLMPPSISASEGSPFVQNWSPTSGWC